MTGESETNGGSFSNNQQLNNGGILNPYFITSNNPTSSLVAIVFYGSNFAVTIYSDSDWNSR